MPKIGFLSCLAAGAVTTMNDDIDHFIGFLLEDIDEKPAWGIILNLKNCLWRFLIFVLFFIF